MPAPRVGIDRYLYFEEPAEEPEPDAPLLPADEELLDPEPLAPAEAPLSPPSAWQSFPVVASLPLRQFGLVPAGFVFAAELLLATLSFGVSVDGTVEGVAGTVDGVVALLGDFDFWRSPMARAFALASANTEIRNTGAILRI